MRSENSRKVWVKDTLTAIDIHDALVVGKIGRGGSNRLLRDALRHGLALELSQPLIVRTAGAAWDGGVRRAAEACGRQ
jgi:hypothetical protein